MIIHITLVCVGLGVRWRVSAYLPTNQTQLKLLGSVEPNDANNKQACVVGTLMEPTIIFRQANQTQHLRYDGVMMHPLHCPKQATKKNCFVRFCK